MDWVTDQFYSHFPSYAEHRTKRAELVKARQLEYQTYLSRVASNSKKSDGKSNKRSTVSDKNTKRPKIPTNREEFVNGLPKSKEKVKRAALAQNVETVEKDIREEVRKQFVNELENMNLPEIFDGDLVDARNRRMAEKRRLQNIQYQQELKDQIEQKKRDKELEKLREREDDERLTRRMEEQLKSVRLQYEMEQERPTNHREHRRIHVDLQKAATIGHSPKLPMITVRSETVEPTAYTYRSYDERKAQSENGKENVDVAKRNDNEIYKFFTNSARDPNSFKDLRYHNYCDFPGELSDFDITPNSMSSAYNTYPSTQQSSQHNNQYESKNRAMCNFCKQHRFLARSQRENLEKYFCGSCENQPICLNCRAEICVRCKKPTNNDRHVSKSTKDDRNYLSVWQPRNEVRDNVKYVRTDNYHPIETDDENLSDSNSDGHKPYSFNIPESSVFHPSRERVNRRLSVSVKNGEVFVKPDSLDELKRITDEKLMKYAKNYGEFRYKKVFDAKSDQSQSNPLPLVKENTRKLMDFAKQLEREDDNGELNRAYTNWQVNGAQEQQQQQQQQQNYEDTQTNDNNAFTFTQIGAFKKQLNLDKLNFD